MVQQNTANKNKGPPKFQHLPKARAKQLKSAWIQTRKIKSKWKAEKRREGINSMEPSPAAPELELSTASAPGISGQKSDQLPDEPHTGSNAPPSRPEGHPVEAPQPQIAEEPVRTAKTGPAVGSSRQKDHRPGRHNHQLRGRTSGHQGKKPSMRNRMNALLEKIQREID